MVQGPPPPPDEPEARRPVPAEFGVGRPLRAGVHRPAERSRWFRPPCPVCAPVPRPVRAGRAGEAACSAPVADRGSRLRRTPPAGGEARPAGPGAAALPGPGRASGAGPRGRQRAGPPSVIRTRTPGGPVAGAAGRPFRSARPQPPGRYGPEGRRGRTAAGAVPKEGRRTRIVDRGLPPAAEPRPFSGPALTRAEPPAPRPPALSSGGVFPRPLFRPGGGALSWAGQRRRAGAQRHRAQRGGRCRG